MPGKALPSTDRTFYWRWVVANGWAEAAGLGTTFVVGQLVAPFPDRTVGVLMVLGGAVIAVVLGTLLEGVVVGAAQEHVLRQRLVRVKPGAWTVATAVGAGLAWLVGMAPSTLLALGAPASAGTPATEPGAAVQLALAGALGIVAGPILGVAQWTVLRRHVAGARRWLWANAAAWAVGMPLIVLGMDRVPWTASPVVMGLAVYAVCGVAGLLVGAIHGYVLVGLLRNQNPRRP